MSASHYCPVCGAPLAAPNQPCPFCAEAQRLLQQLVEKDDVRLCARCGTLLDEFQSDLCPDCREATSARPSFWRRDDRIAGWIRDRFVEPLAEQEGMICPTCESLVPPRAIFCPRCGYKLVGAAEAAPPPAGRPAVAPEESALPGELPMDGSESLEATGDQVLATRPEPTDRGGRSPATAGPSWMEQMLDFWRDQFRPRGPLLEQPTGPWYEQVWRWVRGIFAPVAGEKDHEIWLWIILGVLLVAVAAMLVFWATMLRSGDLVFR